jgi:hypothetical protein
LLEEVEILALQVVVDLVVVQEDLEIILYLQR